jgi:hypothetical protein
VQAGDEVRRLEAEETRIRAELEALATKRRKQPAAAVKSEPRPPKLHERLGREPELQALWLMSRRAELATRYGPLLRTLELSPEQQARFEAIELRREEREFDLRTVEGANGISARDPALVTLRTQVKTEYEEELRSLLGADGQRQKAEFDRTTWIREMVNGIMGGAVVVAREPLSREQGERLVQVMAAASAQYQAGGRASSGDLDWERIDAAARTFLSEAQFALAAPATRSAASGAVVPDRGTGEEEGDRELWGGGGALNSEIRL